MTRTIDGADEPGLSYSYSVRAEEDPVQSRLQGRKVTRPVEFQKIRFPGTADFQVRPVSEAIRANSESFKGWKAGRLVGTPIEKLIGKPLGAGEVSQEIVDELRHAGVVTLEQLANVPDSAATFSARYELRKLAAGVLAGQAEEAQVQVVARRDGEVASLKAENAALAARLARLESMLTGQDAPATKSEETHVRPEGN